MKDQTSYKDLPPIYTSPFFTLTKIFERNPEVQQITFSAYKTGGHFTHEPHMAFGYWNRDQPIFFGDTVLAHYLGQIVMYDLLDARKLLEENLPPDLREKLPLIDEEMEKTMEALQLSVNSKVLMKDGSYAHIPMLDFSSRLEGDIDAVKIAAKRLGEKEGHIFNSGRGDNAFHYYGLDVLSPRDWQIFCGKCMLLNTREKEITDVRYIGHRIIDYFGCLRVSRNSKKPNYPRLIAIYRAEDVGEVEPLVMDEERIKEIDEMFEGNAELYKKVQRGEPLIEL